MYSCPLLLSEPSAVLLIDLLTTRASDIYGLLQSFLLAHFSFVPRSLEYMKDSHPVYGTIPSPPDLT